MAVRKTKRGIDEWNECIDTIFNDDELRSEFIQVCKKKRDEVYYWAKEHGFKHWMILRLAKEYNLFYHYESMRKKFFKEEKHHNFHNDKMDEFQREKFLGAYVLKQEVKLMFFMEDLV